MCGSIPLCVLLAVNTDLRRGELLKLHYQMDLRRRILTVRGAGAITGQTRHVPRNSEAIHVIEAWRPMAFEPEWSVFRGSESSKPVVAVKKGGRPSRRQRR